MHEDLHAALNVLDDVGTIFQLIEHVDALELHILLVLQRVLQRRPEVHGDSAQLDFYGNILLAIQEIHRHLHDDVKAAIPIGLGIGDVVLHLHDLQVVLKGKHLHQRTNVVDVRNDDAHAGDVQDVFFHGAHGYRHAVAIELVVDALRRLDARLYMVNRVSA